MTAVLSIRNKNGTLLTEENVLAFSFRKDIYTPYTTLSARVRTPHTNFDDASEILMALNGDLIHHGLIDSLKIEKAGGEYFLNVSSRGFTSLLCQNQIEPGLKMNISFNMLMDDFYNLPYVTHENHADNSSYIYVKPNTSMWDAASNLSYKLLGTYPYIRDTNTVMISTFSAPELFDLNESDASALKIVRHKYFELDMRFLYAPMEALYFRDKYDFRGQKRLFCSYSGYRGEDLCDLISFGNISQQRIGSISIKGSSKGIITETGVYTDKFPH